MCEIKVLDRKQASKQVNKFNLVFSTSNEPFLRKMWPWSAWKNNIPSHKSHLVTCLNSPFLKGVYLGISLFTADSKVFENCWVISSKVLKFLGYKISRTCILTRKKLAVMVYWDTLLWSLNSSCGSYIFFFNFNKIGIYAAVQKLKKQHLQRQKNRDLIHQHIYFSLEEWELQLLKKTHQV